MRRTRLLAPAVALALALVGCTAIPGTPTAAPGAESAASPTQDAGAGEETTALPPGAQAGLDDYNGDGAPDPTCGTQDFGAGLVLRIPCEIATGNQPPDGVTLVAGSLFRLPGSTDVDLTGISGSLVLARDEAGTRVVLVTFNSDALFETGRAEVGSTDTLDATVRLINSMYAGGGIQVRGHTDAIGSVASNQVLSERRATAIRTYLTGHGVQARDVASVGLGSSQPVAEERTADGSDNPEGRRFNRRAEIVIRLP